MATRTKRKEKKLSKRFVVDEFGEKELSISARMKKLKRRSKK